MTLESKNDKRESEAGRRDACATSDLRSAPLAALIDRANMLTEALPYITEFRGQTIVIKYGGQRNGRSRAEAFRGS